jgi:hypothetical protein
MRVVSSRRTQVSPYYYVSRTKDASESVCESQNTIESVLKYEDIRQTNLVRGRHLSGR